LGQGAGAGHQNIDEMNIKGAYGYIELVIKGMGEEEIREVIEKANAIITYKLFSFKGNTECYTIHVIPKTDEAIAYYYSVDEIAHNPAFISALKKAFPDEIPKNVFSVSDFFDDCVIIEYGDDDPRALIVNNSELVINLIKLNGEGEEMKEKLKDLFESTEFVPVKDRAREYLYKRTAEQLEELAKKIKEAFGETPPLPSLFLSNPNSNFILL